MRRSLAALTLLLVPSILLALDGVVVQANGEPAAGITISTVGPRVISARSDAAGKFRLLPSPAVPFTLLLSDGERHQIVHVDALDPGGLRLRFAPVFQESVTVISGSAPNISVTPAAASAVITHEELEIRAPQRLADALEGIAGVSRLEGGASGVPAIRGLARGRTAILLDDARITAERRAGASATFLDPFSLGSIEIARGPGSVAYGSDAFGGVIHARAREPVPGDPVHVRYDISGLLGHSDAVAVGVEVASPLGRGAILGHIHVRDANDDETPGGDPIVDSGARGAGGALRYRIGAFRAGFAVDEGRDIGKPSIDSPMTRTFYPKESSRRFTLGYDVPPRGPWTSLELRAALGSYRLVLDRTSAASFERADTDANDASLRLVGTRTLGKGTLQLGYDGVGRFGLHAVTVRNESRTESIENAQRIGHAIFSVYDATLAPRIALSAGLRGDRIAARNEGGSFGDRSETRAAPSGHLAITLGPWADLRATLQVARGFREPTLSDRYFRGPTGRGVITGNPDLDPERSRQFDGALRWSRGDASVALFAYDYAIRDLIERYRDGRDFFFRNRGEAKIRGIELEASFPLGHGLTAQWSGSVAEGEADGTPLDDIAPPNAAATLRWAGSKGFAFVRLSSFGRLDDPGPTETERDAYHSVEASAGWRLRREIEIRAIIRNAINREYFSSPDPASTLAPGRSLTIAVSGKI